MCVRRTLLSRGALIAGVVLAPFSAQALPWDRDMARQQSYQPGELARSPAEGTVAVGQRPFNMTLDEGEKKLENPIPFTLDSVWRGQHFYRVNCLPCHGATGNGKGPVAVNPLAVSLAVPNILDAFYKERKDGRIYTIMMMGGSNMPRYGYKFSETERWDIVNYVRFLQGRNVEGMKRPE